MIANL